MLSQDSSSSSSTSATTSWNSSLLASIPSLANASRKACNKSTNGNDLSTPGGAPLSSSPALSLRQFRERWAALEPLPVLSGPPRAGNSDENVDLDATSLVSKLERLSIAYERLALHQERVTTNNVALEDRVSMLEEEAKTAMRKITLLESQLSNVNSLLNSSKENDDTRENRRKGGQESARERTNGGFAERSFGKSLAMVELAEDVDREFLFGYGEDVQGEEGKNTERPPKRIRKIPKRYL